MSILKRGLKGAPVKRLQEKLGIAADGDFGPGTEQAVRDFQQKNGLAVDGMLGSESYCRRLLRTSGTSISANLFLRSLALLASFFLSTAPLTSDLRLPAAMRWSRLDPRTPSCVRATPLFPGPRRL